jgi:CxxC motif-containing protein
MSDGRQKMTTTCIVCPNGCQLTVTLDGAPVVTGHRCARGEAYGIAEARHPARVVTCVVRTDSPHWPCVSVKTSAPLSRELIPSLLETLYAMTAPLPVARGDVILRDFRGAGIDVVATKSAPPPGSAA